MCKALKKVENLNYAVALHFMFYNFGRIHQSPRVTPAMEAGLTDHIGSLEEIATLGDSERVIPSNSERKIEEIDDAKSN